MKNVSEVFYELLDDVNMRNMMSVEELEDLHARIIDYIVDSRDCKRDKFILNRANRMADEVRREIRKRWNIIKFIREYSKI